MPRDARSLQRGADRTWRGGSFFNSGAGKTKRGPSPPHGDPDYHAPVSSRLIDSNSTAITVINSAAETVVVSVTAPALTIRNQGATRLMASGTILNTSAAAGTVTFRIKVDDGTSTSTVLATSAVSASTDNDERAWTLDAIMYANDINIQSHWGAVDVSAASANTLAASTYSSIGYSTSALQDIEPLNVNVTAELSAASTNYALVMEAAIFEAITG